MADHSTSCQPGYPLSFLFLRLPEKDVPEHMMIEGFRWSIALTARVLVRTIMDGSTAVMQAIHFDDAKRLRRALLDAPRNQRCIWQLAVEVGSQSISPLYWALRRGDELNGEWLEGIFFWRVLILFICFQKDDLNIFFVDIICYGNRPPRCQQPTRSISFLVGNSL